MNVPLFIAFRYLFAKKTHNIINVISAVSAVGMAIGTAALIIILSVYNGFNGIIKDNLSQLDPDVMICPSEGKFFTPDELIFDCLADDPRVHEASGVLQDNVFLRYGEQQGLAKAKGIDDQNLHFGEIPLARIGAQLAYEMGINPSFTQQLEIFYPDRDSKVSLANPTASLHKVTAKPSELFSLTANTDAELIIVPLDLMQELVDGDGLLSGIELRLEDSSDKSVKAYAKEMNERLPDGLKALDRYQLQPDLYKMMKYEKFAIFLILIFVVIIVAFNIFGSLSMLRIEKEDDVRTLQALGASPDTTRRIFILEGWLISLFGLVCGIVLGVAMSILQQHFGMIKMPGNYLIEAYPVILQWSDVLWTASGVAAIGLATALLSTKAATDPSQE